MNIPPNFNSSVVYDPMTNTYVVQQKIGALNFGEPKIMSFLDYQKYSQSSLINDYWDLRSKARIGDQIYLQGAV